MESQNLMSEKQAAQRLGISRPTLLRLRRRGAIGFFRVATRVLFSEEHLQEFLARVERKPKDSKKAAAARR